MDKVYILKKEPESIGIDILMMVFCQLNLIREVIDIAQLMTYVFFFSVSCYNKIQQIAFIKFALIGFSPI